MPILYGNISQTSNREDWIGTHRLIDDDTGAVVDISNCGISMTVLKQSRNPNYYRDGYYGRVYPNSIILTGSTNTGEISIVDTGTFQWVFPASRMNNLPQGEYQIGIRIANSTQIGQLVIGTVVVLEGIDDQ
jgi:hypothetical protein